MVQFVRILLVLCCVSIANNAMAEQQKITKILMFGDSITAGYGLAADYAPPAQLQKILNEKGYAVHVVNGGVSGDTTAAGRSRLGWTLDQYQPDMVILALGGNDVLRGISPSITRENITAMAELITSREIVLLLSAVEAPMNLGLAYRNQFNALYDEVADDYDVPLYPFLLKNTYGNPSLMQRDGIHPTSDGASVIASELAEYLIKNDLL